MLLGSLFRKKMSRHPLESLTSKGHKGSGIYDWKEGFLHLDLSSNHSVSGDIQGPMIIPADAIMIMLHLSVRAYAR